MTHQTITQASTIWFSGFGPYHQARMILSELGLIDLNKTDEQFKTLFSTDSADIGMAFYDLELATMCKLTL